MREAGIVANYGVMPAVSAPAGPPAGLGITHWSTRTLAAHLKVSRMTVARIWADHDLAPHRIQTFKFSTDLCALYLEPPAGAVVLCVDEKSQIQALDRTAPTLPLRAFARLQMHHWAGQGARDPVDGLDS